MLEILKHFVGDLFLVKVCQLSLLRQNVAKLFLSQQLSGTLSRFENNFQDCFGSSKRSKIFIVSKIFQNIVCRVCRNTTIDCKLLRIFLSYFLCKMIFRVFLESTDEQKGFFLRLEKAVPNSRKLEKYFLFFLRLSNLTANGYSTNQFRSEQQYFVNVAQNSFVIISDKDIFRLRRMTKMVIRQALLNGVKFVPKTFSGLRNTISKISLMKMVIRFPTTTKTYLWTQYWPVK